MISSRHAVPDPRMGAIRVGVVGPGRLGTALAGALRAVGFQVDGPARRGRVPQGEAIVLCVPDAEIPVAAEVVAGAAPLVGHTSGATPLSALEPAAREGAATFGLHPLQTFSGEGGGLELFAGVGCAVAGSTPKALAAAERLATAVGMRPFELADDARPLYHAAASVASNFLVTLQAAAEELAAGAGLEPQEARELLAPLVRQTMEQWAARGPARALTGPLARGDEATVDAQRAAVEDEAPHLVPLFDALVERTRELAGRTVPA